MLAECHWMDVKEKNVRIILIKHSVFLKFPNP